MGSDILQVNIIWVTEALYFNKNGSGSDFSKFLHFFIAIT